MYVFKKQLISGFTIYTATPNIGDLHYKKFSGTVTPTNQETLNVYVMGSFLVRCGTFEQLLSAGQTSLDISLDVYPAEQIYVEKVMGGPAKRLCVSKQDSTAWYRQRVLVNQDWTALDSGILIYLDGDIVPVLATEPSNKHGEAIFCK